MMNRREFSFGVACLPLVLVAPRLSFGCKPATSLVDAREPGTRLLLRGTLFASDGRTPLPGYLLELYQTDAEGYYSRPVSDPRKARLRGSLRTDEQGGYAFTTILPGHYPGRSEASHIHAHLSGPNVPPYSIDSFLFEGDPFLRDDDRARSEGKGHFSAIVRLERDNDGVHRGRRDLRFDPDEARAKRLVNGWYR